MARNDDLLHEPGDIAILVTPERLIVVDDKLPQHTDEIGNPIKGASALPQQVVDQQRLPADHSGDDNFIKLTDIAAYRNVGKSMIKNKHPNTVRVPLTGAILTAPLV
jgi:hypothetical protein